MTAEHRNRIRALAEKCKTSDPTSGSLEGVLAVACLYLLDEPQGGMAFAWVIEHADSEPSRPRYFDGVGWSDPGDHEAALRFAREVDADRYMRLMDWPAIHRVREHGWDTSPAPSSCSAQGIAQEGGR